MNRSHLFGFLWVLLILSQLLIVFGNEQPSFLGRFFPQTQTQTQTQVQSSTNITITTNTSQPKMTLEGDRTINDPSTLLSKKSPIILVPGDGGSQIFAKLNKPDVVHYFCDKKTDYFFSLWLNLALLVPFVIDCWVDNMQLMYNTTSRKTFNSPGVETMIPGFGNTTTVEFVDPSQLAASGYYNVLVKYMVDHGYTRGVDIRGAPYDFRKSPTELDDYYESLDALIRETYEQNGNEKVILICHSMGCPITLYHLNRLEQSFKDKYLKSYVTLASPWGGAVKALKAFTSGDNLGVVVVPALTIRKDERTFPSLAYLMPSDQFWDADEVLMQVGDKNYTTKNYKELFDDIDYDTGYQMWEDTRNLTYDLIPPEVEVHCIHGKGVPTMEFLEYKEGKFPDAAPKINFGDGDSTVNSRSLKGCLRWRDKQERPVNYLDVEGVDHMSVMTDERILEYIVNIAKIHKN